MGDEKLENAPSSEKKPVAFEKNMLLRQISQMTNIPTPSPIIIKVMHLLRDEDVQTHDLIAAIERDQSLVSQILKLINSGFYGLRKSIDSVERAVNLLGIFNIKQLVYSASIMDLFSKDEQKEWDHSYSSSVLMTHIMKENDIPAASNLPLTMLMHDIGKVILRRFSPKKYKMALIKAQEKGIPLYQAEDAIIHIDHAEVGGMLMKRWNMTDDITIPVLSHHLPEVPEHCVIETALTQFVNWVDCSARKIPCAEPSPKLMQAAGFEEIDKNYWTGCQIEIIEAIEGRLYSDNPMTDTKKLARQESETPHLPPAAETDTKNEDETRKFSRPAAAPVTIFPLDDILEIDKEKSAKPIELDLSTRTLKRPVMQTATDEVKQSNIEEKKDADVSTRIFRRPGQEAEEKTAEQEPAVPTEIPPRFDEKTETETPSEKTEDDQASTRILRRPTRA